MSYQVEFKDTRQERRDHFERLAEDAFRLHVICKETEERWLCHTPGSSMYHFRIVVGPKTIVLYGDVGDLVLHPTGPDPMHWLRSVLKPSRDASNIDYFMEKVPALLRNSQRVFLVKEAQRHIDWIREDEEAEVEDLIKAVKVARPLIEEERRLHDLLLTWKENKSGYHEARERLEEIEDSEEYLTLDEVEEYEREIAARCDVSNKLVAIWGELRCEVCGVFGYLHDDLPSYLWRDTWSLAHLKVYGDSEAPDCEDWSNDALWCFFALRKFVALLLEREEQMVARLTSGAGRG